MILSNFSPISISSANFLDLGQLRPLKEARTTGGVEKSGVYVFLILISSDFDLGPAIERKCCCVGDWVREFCSGIGDMDHHDDRCREFVAVALAPPACA